VKHASFILRRRNMCPQMHMFSNTFSRCIHTLTCTFGRE